MDDGPVATDTGETGELTPPEDVSSFAFPLGVVPNGTAAFGADIIVVGTTDTEGQFRDAFVSVVGPEGSDAYFISGQLERNDQLYAVAASGSSTAATGLTRSFNDGGSADETLLVLAPHDPNPTVVRLYVAADEFLQGRAIAPGGGDDWIVAGQYLGNARGYLARIDDNGTVNAAVSVGHASVAQDFDPLRVLDIDGRYVLGFRNGVVAAFDPATFEVQWAIRLLRNGAPVLITDIAPADGHVIVTAAAGILGVVAAVDLAAPETLGVSAGFLGSAPRGLAVSDSEWITGTRGQTTFVARLGATGLEGIQLDGFAQIPSAFLPMHMVDPGGSMVVVPRIEDGFAVVPFNDAPIASCAGSPHGTAFAEAGQDPALEVELLALDTMSLPLLSELPTDVAIEAVPLTEAGCPPA